MRFRDGAPVYTADGQQVGEIHRVVLDPATRELTHVIVRKGFFFAEDKVVPVSLIATASDDRVTLREDAEDLDQLPVFEEIHFVAADSGTRMLYPTGYAGPLYWYPPPGTMWWTPPMAVELTRHIPEGTVAVWEGARVISSDGEHVGDVEAVLTEPEGDRATHLLVSSGLILTEQKLVPANWVSRLGETEVHLAVSSELLDELEPYEG